MGMNTSIPVLERLSDPQLLAEVTRLAAAERVAIGMLVAALAEFDARGLYLGQGCSSMFTYCTQVLHLAEHAAYNRIEAARAARRFPMILTWLAGGRLHLSAIRLLAPHLTEANHQALLDEASHKSKREVEQIVARLQPRVDVPSVVRKLPSKETHLPAVPPPRITAAHVDTVPLVNDVATPCAAQSGSPARPKTEPLAPGRYKVQFTIAQETYQKLRRVQDLLSHRVPNGDLATIFDRALTLLLANVEKSKIATTGRPRTGTGWATRSRHVPAAIRRAVWKRDEGRCRFEGPAGRCSDTGFLEFHHVVPYADGGTTTIDNIELRCAAHNRYEAAQWFGVTVREVTTSYEATLSGGLNLSSGTAIHVDGSRYEHSNPGEVGEPAAP